MRKSLRISALILALASVPGFAGAAGLGRLTVMSALGQPLKAEIELLAVQADEADNLSARLAGADAFRQARLDRSESLNNVRFSIDKRPNGQPVLRISSTQPIGDPFVDLLIELSWSSGRILREYTLLLDPPSDARAAGETGKEPPTAILPGRTEATKPAPAQSASDVAKPADPKTTDPKAAESKPGEKKPGEAKVADKVVASQYGPVKKGDTLSGIAGKVRPPEVAMEVVMASLFEANKNAFARGNMNLLRKGRTLNVPEQTSMLNMFSHKQAKDLIREHGKAWNEYRGMLADTAAKAEPAPAAAKDGAKTGKIVAAPTPAKPTPAPTQTQDVLKLSKGQPAPNASEAQKQQAKQEELAAKARSLKEAQERVAQLEKTVKDLNDLKKMQEKAPPPPPPPQPVAKPPVPAVVEVPAQVAPPAPAPAQPPAPAPAPVVAQPPAPSAPEEPGLLSKLLDPLYLGGAAVVLLLGFLGWSMLGKRRHRKLAQLEQSVIGSADDFKTAIFRSTVGAPPQNTQQTTSVMTDYSRLGLGAIDTHEVDPIAEAEVYMAYGRDAQAEEILKEALSKDPQRHEIAVKLLEIYASRRDTVSFETQASEVYAALSGKQTPLWEKIAEMGRGIDPENPLYQFKGEGAPPGFPRAPEAAPVADTWRDAPVAAPVVAPVAQVASAELDRPDLDKLFGEDAEAMPPAEGLSMKVDDFDDAIDFGFQNKPEPAKLDNPFAAMPELPEPTPAEPDKPAAEATLADFDFEIDDFDTMKPADKAAVDTPAVAELPEMDFSGIDLDLGKDAAATGIGDAVEDAVEESIDPELWEEVNTKLDLSKAYIEMGDKEGAREILDEVAKEGDSKQKAQARELLASMA